MDTSNPKAAIVDKIKKSTNILVTVAHDPSVDALAAALGFSLMLNKLDKHATAVFSGAVPPAITFLEPEKTFEGTVDSLRDFIIAIDKQKADRLRYKVEGDVVRIYITPYRTNLSEKDLQYSQGDYNVDLVIALGVEKQSDLDQAISAHGRILHDASVATINTSNVKSSIGTIDWSDDKASSLCEMLMSLSEALQSNLLDEQIATALLTGIVAATDRFSNVHTTPRVMTMSAQLMAAGANQQLIAEKLQEGGESLTPAMHEAEPASSNEDNTVHEAAAPNRNDGEIHVRHDDTPNPPNALENAGSDANRLSDDPNNRLEEALGHIQPLNDLNAAIETSQDVLPAVDQSPVTSTDWRTHIHDPQPETDDDEPMMGGTLNATASEAEEAKREEERSVRNHTILSHDSQSVDLPELPPITAGSQNATLSDSNTDDVEPIFRESVAFTKGKTIQPVTMSPIKTPFTQPLEEPEKDAPYQHVSPPSAPFDRPPAHTDIDLGYEATPLISAEPAENQTLADLEAEVHAAAQSQPATSSIDDARAAVSSAFTSQPISVGGQPTPLPSTSDVAQPASTALPPLPSMTDFSALPPLPPMPEMMPPTLPSSPHPAVMPPQFPPVPSEPSTLAPGQFRIPGQ